MNLGKISITNLIQFLRDIRFHYEIYSLMSTPTRTCSLVFYTSHHLLRKIIIWNIPRQNLTNFLNMALEKFSVNVQQHLLICGIDNA